MRVLLTLSLLGWASCARVPSPGAAAGRPPVSWRLVEAPAPGGKELVFEAVEPSASMRVEIRFSRVDAAIGEEVEAEIRLPGAAGVRRIEVLPDRAGVTILGPSEFLVEEGGSARARFTCRVPGRGGITVVVKD